MIYFPQSSAISYSQNILKLAVADAELQITTRPYKGPKAIIYFGGNAEDVALNLTTFSNAFPDHAIYLMHYRSYGTSTGKPSEEAIQQDALSLFDNVFAQHSYVVVVGRSLGTGVATRLASQLPVLF